MIFPNSLVKLAWLPKLPRRMTLAFQQCHLQVCLWGEETEAMPFKTLPPTVDTFSAGDHYLRFLPRSHLLCELIFVMWDMKLFNLWCVCVCAWNTTLASSLHHQSEAESCNRWRRSIKSLLEAPRTCWKRSIKSVFDVPRITESWKKHIYIYISTHTTRKL